MTRSIGWVLKLGKPPRQELKKFLYETIRGYSWDTILERSRSEYFFKLQAYVKDNVLDKYLQQNVGRRPVHISNMEIEELSKYYTG